jgi:glycosyltransferase involved in cell wall biosynthesis
MNQVPVDISVVLSTYNRASRLGRALDALLRQSTNTTYEVIVVDNNSSDATENVVQTYAARHLQRVRYAFEPQQGLSHGRNHGIKVSRGAIIAFTDDDVEVEPDWIERIARAFEENPAAAYISGRVLPRWQEPPPRWLRTAHWSPLALQDYGESPMRVGAFWPICLVGASLAFRRSVFERVGLFAPSFGRIRDGIGSTEDHQMQLRIWEAGLEGLYVPAMRTIAEIPPERMRKAYHRRWHRGHGRHCARMRLRDVIPRDWAPMRRPDDLVTLFGVPAFVYAEVPKTMQLWLEAIYRRRDPFFYSNRLRHLFSYIVESWRCNRVENSQSALGEIARFSVAYARRVARRMSPLATR